MSGRVSIRFVDFAVFSFEFDRVRCALVGAFLVRNWCGDASLAQKSRDWHPQVSR